MHTGSAGGKRYHGSQSNTGFAAAVVDIYSHLLDNTASVLQLL